MTILVGHVWDADTNEPWFAVVATDEGAEYIMAPYSGTKADAPEQFTPDRLEWLTSVLGEPNNALAWYNLATYNLGEHTGISVPEEQRTPGAARGRATELMEQQLGNVVGNVGRRADLMGVGEAYDAWAETHPDAAEAMSEGDDIDPQDMLDLQLLRLKPTNPDVDHDFMPHTIGEDECAICSMPLDWEAHTNRDTMKDTATTDGG